MQRGDEDEGESKDRMAVDFVGFLSPAGAPVQASALEPTQS